jgi:hypothetical protein
VVVVVACVVVVVVGAVVVVVAAVVVVVVAAVVVSIGHCPREFIVIDPPFAAIIDPGHAQILIEVPTFSVYDASEFIEQSKY